MMHESTLSWHTTLHDPWPHLHRCNMTLAATIHFGLWSRFNEFLLCCVCMSPGLALSLVLLATTESWKYITWLSKTNMFSHCKTRLCFQSSEIWRNRYSGSHILSLFVCFLTFTTIPTGLWQISNRPPWQPCVSMDTWIAVFYKFGPYETIWLCQFLNACMCSHVPSSKLCRFCCYFGGPPK